MFHAVLDNAAIYLEQEVWRIMEEGVCVYMYVIFQCVCVLQESTKKLSVKKLPIITCFHLKVYTL